MARGDSWQYSRPGLHLGFAPSVLRCLSEGVLPWGKWEAFERNLVRMSEISSVGEGKHFQVEEAAFAKVQKPREKYVSQGGDELGYSQITQIPGQEGRGMGQGREGGQWFGIFKSNSSLDPVPRPISPCSCHIRRDAVI